MLSSALREVAAALERGRHAQPDRVAAVDRVRRRTVLVRVEEEQLVGAARLADRTADRVAERLRASFGLGSPFFSLTQLFAFQSESVSMS